MSGPVRSLLKRYTAMPYDQFFANPAQELSDSVNTTVNNLNTQVPALAPEEIEKLVTFPIENEMAGIPGLLELRSLSKFGLSQVTLVFEEGTDIYRSRQLVSERLQSVVDELPEGLTPKLAPVSTGLGEIYYYVVEYTADATNKPLHGIVFSIKDVLDTFDMRTTSGGDADFANDRPPDDSTVVKRLRAAGPRGRAG